MDDFELRSLADDGAAPDVEPRPVEAVLRRSHQIRRRGRVLKVAGVTAVAAGVFVANTHVDVSDRVDLVPQQPPELDCVPPYADDVPDRFVDESSSHRLAVEDVDDDLRLLPAVVPEGMEVREVSAGAVTPIDFCPLELVLSLRADGGDAIVDATIEVRGPTLDEPFDGFRYGGFGDESLIPLRGTMATLYDETQTQGIGPDDRVALSWTDRAGDRWVVLAEGLDAQTVTAVAEAVVLDPDDQPVADLPPEAIPAGLAVVWRPETTGGTDSGPWWSVTFHDPSSTRDACTLHVRRAGGESPLEATGAVGDQLTAVHGQPAWLRSGSSLRWQEAGVQIYFECGGVTDDELLAVAESVEPVAADDPRLPGG